MYLFLFLTLYVFRAHRAHHQERQTVSIQPLVTVGGRVCDRVVCRRHGHRQLPEVVLKQSVRHVGQLPTVINKK